MAFWCKADEANPSTVAGHDWAQGIGDGFGQVAREDTTDPVFGGGTEPYQWTRLHLNGWIRETDRDYEVRLLYDDIYLATGPHAAARVEIGNKANYSECTMMAISTPTAWSGTQITATVREGCFRDGDAVWVFVVDDQNVPSAGFGPLVFHGKARGSKLGGNSQITAIGSGASLITFKGYQYDIDKDGRPDKVVMGAFGSNFYVTEDSDSYNIYVNGTVHVLPKS
jgi:hypothetical protein